MTKEQLKEWFLSKWNNNMNSDPIDIVIKIENGDYTTQSDLQPFLKEL